MEVVERMSADAVMVGHNVAFDWGFVIQALTECKLMWNGRYHKCDTAALAWPLLVTGRVSDVKLATLMKYIQREQQAAHTAADDAESCRLVYCHLISLYRAALHWSEVSL
jgi:DNA polymerase-3 subunit epsilon